MNGSVTDEPETVSELLAAVRAQQETVQRLVHLLEQRQSEPPPERPDPQQRWPIDWDVISGAARAVAWQSLGAFVEKIVLRYNLQFDVLPCWWQHRNAVMVLTSLWEVHLHTFGEDANLLSNNTFLDNLNYRIEQLRGIFMSCREEHTDSTPRTWMSDATRRAFQQMIASET